MPTSAPTPAIPADEEDDPPFLRTTLRGCSTGLFLAGGESGAGAAAAPDVDLAGGGDSGEVAGPGTLRETAATTAGGDAPAGAVTAVHAAATADAAVPACSAAKGWLPRRLPAAAVDTVPGDDAAADGDVARRSAADSRLAADDDSARVTPDMGDTPAAAAAAAVAGAATETADGGHAGTQPPSLTTCSCLTDTTGDGTAGAVRGPLAGRPADVASRRTGSRTELAL